MVACQEELDWETYRLYGLVDENLTYRAEDLPELAHGERAFEISLARAGEWSPDVAAWFDRHQATPVTDLPAQWPAGYRDLVRRRLDLIKSHPMISLLERPEYKRRWAHEPWERLVADSLKRWLLGRLEGQKFWFDRNGRPTPKSVAVLADEVARDEGLMSVLALWEGRRDAGVTSSLERLLATEAVPYLAAMRYKPSGMRKRAAWERTWELQRDEDARALEPGSLARSGADAIPVPPTYPGADFVRPEYWAHRSKLDVPKEPFILYPGAGRDGDATLVIGWAGWDHSQQALALATLIQSGEQQGWADERLIPLVAGLSELLPWVEQWHSEPDVLYAGSSPAQFFTGLLDNYMAKLGSTRESLAAWRPPAPTRGRKAKS